MATLKGVDSNRQFQTIKTTTSGVLLSAMATGSGTAIATHLSADGDYHLGTSMEQNVVADPKNTSTDNLGIGNL